MRDLIFMFFSIVLISPYFESLAPVNSGAHPGEEIFRLIRK